jgi:hypothetical protein
MVRMLLIIREFFAKVQITISENEVVQITISDNEIYFTKGKFNKTRKWKNR